MKRLLYISLSLLALSGCYYDNEEELYPLSEPNPHDTIRYSTHIQPMMAGNCAISGCHVAGAQPPDLSTYQGVFINRDRVKARAIDEVPSPMPAAGPMSQDNKHKLGKWIADGAPNN